MTHKTAPLAPASLAGTAPITVGSDGLIHATRMLIGGRPTAISQSLCRITTHRGQLNVMPAHRDAGITCPACATVVAASAAIVAVTA